MGAVIEEPFSQTIKPDTLKASTPNKYAGQVDGPHRFGYDAAMFVSSVKPLLFLALVSALPAVGGTVALPDVPAPAFADLETVTNAAIRASMLQSARVFDGSLSLLATPSNMVEVAFGTSRDADGILLPGDESFSVGWREGAWFIASATNRVESAAMTNAASRSLSFQLRLTEDGEPHRLTLTATGAGDAFAALVADPPDWMFSRDWNAVRLTIRGADDPAEAVSVQFNTDPWVLIMS